MPLDPTLDELAGQQQWSPSDVASMTHQASQPNPVRGFLDYAQQPALPRPPLPGEERINQALARQDPRYVPAQPQQQQNWQRWGEEILNNLPFGFTGVLAGERGLGELAARTGDTSMIDLDMAKQMEAQGMTRSQIRTAKEWFKENSTGIWNKEIFDNPATLNEFKMPMHANYQNQQSTVGEILNHPDLYNVYPHLKDLPVTFKNEPYIGADYGTYYHPTTDHPNGIIVLNNAHNRAMPELKKTLLHELQHAVDIHEGRKFSNQTGLSIRQYLKLIEEARARNVEFRSDYTPEQLRKQSMNPWWTMRQMRDPVSEMATKLPPP